VSELTADGLELGMRFTDTRGYEYTLLALSNALASTTVAGEVLTYVDADTVTNDVSEGTEVPAGIVEGAFAQSSATGTGRTAVLLLVRGIHTGIVAGSSTIALGSTVQVDTSNDGECAVLTAGTAVTSAISQLIIGLALAAKDSDNKVKTLVKL
tara:strand:- start:302 stop:763 length:462 start_codon:yes stop_codon:yes gene_type:complete